METEDGKQKNKENRRHIETKHDNMHPPVGKSYDEMIAMCYLCAPVDFQ